MIKRELEHSILEAFKKFPVVAITGPRQSGKTTLVKELFKQRLKYVNLEDLEMRSYARQDPKSFLNNYSNGAIIDEVQNVPELFSYIQVFVDETNTTGQFILTGSQNFLLHEQIAQSLAGRVALFYLLPLTTEELLESDKMPSSLEKILFTGCYPRIYDKEIEPYQWYANYLQTYVEKDLRLIKNIHDLGAFQLFLKMCASRAGQLLDMNSIGNDCGISNNTVKAWIEILERSFIIFLLRPHYRNFNKRLVKTPKIYFYDTGLLCHLLGIESSDQLQAHIYRGGIFESFVISQLMKHRYNQGKSSNLYFWRDRFGKEIDCIIERNSELIPIEIKSAKTINDDFFKNLLYWNRISETSSEKNYLIYGGDLNQKREKAHVLSWRQLDDIFDTSPN